ncbi:MAG: DUF998 domain-containing protein [Candidatus Bathyarchaeia archaeon]
MNSRSIWLKTSGVCGVLTSIIAFGCIFSAIASYPKFNWMSNALSDLGVVEGITAPLFNFGLIISGILALVFATGLLTFINGEVVSTLSTVAFVLTALALTAIGIFPENVKPAHYYASVAFFLLSIVSMIIVGVNFLITAKVKVGLLALLMAAIAATTWITYFVTHFVEGVAIPEAISALSVSTVSMILGFKMLKDATLSSS